MERKIAIFIKNNKVYIGRDKESNSLVIDTEKIKEKDYKIKLIKLIERIENTKQVSYIPGKERKVIERINTRPASSGYNSALVGMIKKNERIRKEIEEIRDLLK